MTDKLSDNWQTPQDLFDELDKEFNFDIDLCATKENSKCYMFCDDYLKGDLQITKEIKEEGHYSLMDALLHNKMTCFMNPPYSNPRPFIEKAWEDSKHCKIVCLVKCDPSTKWWATFWNYGTEMLDVKFDGKQYHFDGYSTKMYYGPKPGCEVRFFPKRIQFDPPQELINSGEVWKELTCTRRETCGTKTYHPEDCGKCGGKGYKWVKKCERCRGRGNQRNPFAPAGDNKCYQCKGKGYTKLSGPTFSSALIIMDRRNV